ncbi:palmitoleoyl-protein carboxylesterase NOTUM-like isoform X2 [Dendronephthya gigantea]|uniref:palmitoleoyl-protein carboxylesterase NOTUM-like isoform X2 n=1 Tax=Dendronephthya gigantea TaxID=151771 RepID=UPI00106A784D|nr:palmitoleoyl-protein carboxylesterase NOTUM-like isoform X2 [Dendronephthya gigantea]
MDFTSYFALFLIIILYVTAAPFPSNGPARKIQMLQYRVKYLTRELLKCQEEDKLDLHLRSFQNRQITCNDGTTAGYYIKRSYESNKWIIYLEGGWYCFNDASCTQRMNVPDRKSLTSSRDWLSKRRGFGILSPIAMENPTWYNANHVLIPYCSSDAWSGNVSRQESGGKFSFMGYRIINEVIKELLPQGLLEAKHLLLAGSSVGGIGVIMSIDRVAQMLSAAGSSCKVRGISDSGWYLEKIPDLKKCKNDPRSCNKPSQAIRKGMRYWNGVVPSACREEFKTEPWRCYFGHNVYRTLRSPLFIFQWQYDLTQVIVNNPTTHHEQSFGQELIRKLMMLASDMKTSMRNNRLNAVFLPACMAHSTLTNSDWLSVKVKGYTLNRAINCWISKDDLKNTTPSPNLASAHCKSALIDDCSQPLCNSLCPAPRNPFTGELLATPTNSTITPSPSLGLAGMQNDQNPRQNNG